VADTASELERLRTAVVATVAELRRLAAGRRAEVAHLANTSSPYGFGPNQAAEAYDKAAALVEQTLGGGTS
jgi:hypothetical protein